MSRLLTSLNQNTLGQIKLFKEKNWIFNFRLLTQTEMFLSSMTAVLQGNCFGSKLCIRQEEFFFTNNFMVVVFIILQHVLDYVI